jgi:acyl-coenzyme A thioesterase PaaI-like protein
VTPPDGQGASGAELHYRALERLYDSAPVNALFASRLEITGEGRARIRFDVTEAAYHAAGAAHGTIYFKMLDDAAFYAANTLVTGRSGTVTCVLC